MKTLFLCSFALLVSTTIIAQNKNVKVETTTTTRTKKDSDGSKKTTKSEVTKEVQKIELGATTPGTINVPTVNSPVEVTTTTKIINPDGSTRTVDVDRSAFYESNGNRFKLDLDASGYLLSTANSKSGLLRKTSTNSYIYNNKDKNAVAYFDLNGNLIVESYDASLDKIIVEKYMLAVPAQN